MCLPVIGWSNARLSALVMSEMIINAIILIEYWDRETAILIGNKECYYKGRIGTLSRNLFKLLSVELWTQSDYTFKIIKRV